MIEKWLLQFPLALLSPVLYYYFFLINLFIYLFLAALGLRSSGRYSSLQCTGFSLQQLRLLRSTGSRRAVLVARGLSCSTTWGLS